MIKLILTVRSLSPVDALQFILNYFTKFQVEVVVVVVAAVAIVVVVVVVAVAIVVLQ